MNNYPCGGDKVSKEKDPCRKSVCISDTCWIERPKFFNGQLLTDVDLTAGLDYVIEKNKLHNRYLHGWGVVCGLKVKCYPCCKGHGSSGKVVVEPGYAIDCCGNDIVVCEEQEYDVIKKINEMIKKKKAQASPCEPGAVVEETECTGQEEKYYLTLSYREEDAKPTAALKGSDPCSIQSCVPSRTKECFEFDLVKYCTLEPTPQDSFIKRVSECIKILTDTMQKFAKDKDIDWASLGTANGPSAEDIKEFIREYYNALPSAVRCDVLDKLEEMEEEVEEFEKPITDPDHIGTLNGLHEGTFGQQEHNVQSVLKRYIPGISNDATITKDGAFSWVIADGSTTYRIQGEDVNGEGFLDAATISSYNVSLIGLFILFIQLMLDCICQALLNPCPTCGEDDVVILATITVKKNKIEKICNFSRKWVMSFPTLFYWLPLNQVIGNLVEQLCCWIDFGQKGSLPKWMYMAKAFENNFAIPRDIIKNFETVSQKMPDSIFKVFDPANVSMASAVNKNSKESETILKELKMEVVGTEKVEVAAADLSLEGILANRSYARPGSRVIQLVDHKDNVVGFRVVEGLRMETRPTAEPAEPGEPLRVTNEEVKVLKKMLSDMSKKVNTMEKELKELKSKSVGDKTSGAKTK